MSFVIYEYHWQLHRISVSLKTLSTGNNFEYMKQKKNIFGLKILINDEK